MGVYYFSSDYIYDHGKWKSDSIFIKDNKFTITFTNKKTAQEMDVSPFWVGPGKVYVDLDDPVYRQQDYQSSIKKYIYRGCTLLLCQLPISSRYGLKQKFSQFKQQLSLVSPIDFMIVPRIPASKLAVEHIKFFGKEKVPFILVEADDVDELKQVKWEWIQQYQSFSGTPISYISDTENTFEKDWQKLAKKYRIISIDDTINHLPLSKQLLRQTGISPHKGEFIHQGCADYTLFDRSTLPTIDEDTNFRYHKAIPVITVSNGTVVKSNHIVQLDATQGKYTPVSIPRHFV
ncbi:hypothetical protein [Aquibacillus sediminis]|uniref:hypothetical protein n=1 Tax=Aquibacillus sediminis TaxID=2574734 RepID=UPI001109BF49|nr:hypothetical protein [Aquibacillus sediminis]